VNDHVQITIVNHTWKRGGISRAETSQEISHTAEHETPVAQTLAFAPFFPLNRLSIAGPKPRLTEYSLFRPKGQTIQILSGLLLARSHNV
jgi:hypothetical protein